MTSWFERDIELATQEVLTWPKIYREMIPMSDKIIPFGGITYLDLPTDRILEEAKGDCSDGVVIIGFDDEGELYFASSMADGGEVIWLLELAKKRLLEQD